MALLTQRGRAGPLDILRYLLLFLGMIILYTHLGREAPQPLPQQQLEAPITTTTAIPEEDRPISFSPLSWHGDSFYQAKARRLRNRLGNLGHFVGHFETADEIPILGEPIHSIIQHQVPTDSDGTANPPHLPQDYSHVDLNPYCLNEMPSKSYCPQLDDNSKVWDVYSSYMDRALHQLINALRVSPEEYTRNPDYKGRISCKHQALPPFRYESLLQQAAKQMTRIIADPSCPNKEHNTCYKYCDLYPSCSYLDRINAYSNDYEEVGENLLIGPGHLIGAVSAWIQSVGHCNNIFYSRFNHMGSSYYYAGNNGGANKNHWITDFALRRDIYNNPIYSGAHFLLGDNGNYVRFMATYYSDAAVQRATLVINGESFDMGLHMGSMNAGTFNKDFNSASQTGCADYYFLFTDEYGSEWRLPEKGAYATAQLAGCEKNYYVESSNSNTQSSGEEPASVPQPTPAFTHKPTPTSTRKPTQKNTPKPTASQASPNKPSTQPYRYMGCYKEDDDNPMFNGNITVSETMTHKVCYSFCKDSPGTLYFGVRQGYSQPGRSLDLCFCGDTGGFAQSYQAGTCTHPCGGDRSIICGSRDAYSVFQIQQ